jgi:hypothetical protein
MRRLTTLLLGVVISLLWLTPITTLALGQPEFGGNNSTDYQPPTGNPQTNLPGSLQPTNATLQPVTTINQQALIQSGGLTVLTAPDKGATSTVSQPNILNKHSNVLITWIIGGLLTIVAVVYILSRPDTKPQTTFGTSVQSENDLKIVTPKAVKAPAQKGQGKTKKSKGKKKKTAKR